MTDAYPSSAPTMMDEEPIVGKSDPTQASLEVVKNIKSVVLPPAHGAQNILDDAGAKVLESTPIGLMHKTVSRLFQLNPDDSVMSCTEFLGNHGIGSAPVWDNIKRRYIGFVDDLDLAVFIVNAFAEQYQAHPHLYDPKELEKSFMHPVRELINASKVDPFCPVDSKSSLLFVISNFLRHGIHRVPVCDNSGNIIGLLSQSDVVAWLSENGSHFSSILNRRLDEVGLEHGEVISVTNDVPLLRAFTTILTNKISGLAVVDMRTGELINNLSASDLKGVSFQSVYKLEVPIHQIFMYGRKMPPVTCSLNSSVGEAMRSMINSGVHRIYVVDSERRPLNVITLTDILQLFCTTFPTPAPRTG